MNRKTFCTPFVDGFACSAKGDNEVSGNIKL